ncbi:MAG: HlyC/CorC family transporter [Anaerolineae bacterium]|nr:HlyC/CorC family transporter [Anaerolineae bacterium]
MSIGLELFFLMLLIVVNGVFAMSELAVVSARKTRLQQRAQEGDRKASVALELANAPNQFLATIQIGITLVGIFAGAFGGATLAEEMAEVFTQVPFLAAYGEAISVAIVVLATTYLSLVIGELVPKRLAMSNPEQIASTVAPAMRTLSRLASPVVRLLSFSTDLLIRLLGTKEEGAAPVSEEEIRLLLQQGTEVGIFEPREQEVVERAFALADQTVNVLMTPRREVVWLDLSDPIDEILERIADAGHSRYPVAQDNLDHVKGFVYAKDLLRESLAGRPIDLQALLRPAVYLPETITALRTIEHLKEAQVDIAVVIDEYAGFQGILTVDDILEALVGAIPEAGVEVEPEAVQRQDGSWLLDGWLSTDEVKEMLGIQSLPREDTSYYQTLGGLVMFCLDHIPTAGDHFVCSGWRFEVVDMDGLRVDKVLATLMGRIGEPI